MKRLIALFLSLTMLLSLCPINIWAEELTAKDQQVYIAEDTSADDLSGDDSAVESESQTEDEQNSTDDEVVVEDSSASAPSEEEETPSEGEDETAENGEAEFGFESITVSTPVANAAATVETRWGLATGTNKDQAPADDAWAGSGTVNDAMSYANGRSAGEVAYIQLLNDVETSTYLNFKSGYTTVLDLNGYTVDRNLSTEKSGGYVVYVSGKLTLCDTNASASGEITGGNNGGSGGGVLVTPTGVFTMNGGYITGNKADKGGGVYVQSGGTFLMNGGHVAKNDANNGGGVFVTYNGTFTLNDATISGNTAVQGGGVYLNSTCTFNMTDGVICGNSANQGGAVNITSSSTFTMSGGTIFGNRAFNGGGGVVNYGTIEVSGTSVIAENVLNGTLNSTTGLYELGASGSINNVHLASGKLITVNTLSSGTSIGVTMADGTGTFTSGGGRYAESCYFFSDNTYYVVVADGSGNLKLADAPPSITITFDANGGSGTMSPQAAYQNIAGYLHANTFTREGYIFTGWNEAANGSGRSYIDTEIFKLASSVTLYAQWEKAEAQWGLATGTNNDQKPDSWTGGSFEEAIAYANGLTSGTAYIQMCGDVIGWDYTFNANTNTILDLNGKTINGDVESTVIRIDGNLTLCDTSAGANGKITRGFGSGVRVYGTFTMNGGTISGNTAGYGGGGVLVNGTFTMNGGTISSNTADYGGGVSVEGGAFTMNGGTISNNTASGNIGSGGGVNVISAGTFTMNGGTISDNTASSGGGVYINGLTFTMTGGTITGNTAGSAGGVYVGGTMAVSGTPKIYGNTMKGVDMENNVHLAVNKTITVDALTSEATIGITMLSLSGTFTSGGADYADKFFSDNTSYEVVVDGENLALAEPTRYATATFHANGGGGNMEPQTVVSGMDVTLNSNAFTRQGYVFNGWNTKSDGTGTTVPDKATFLLQSDVAFYAQWKHSHLSCGVANCTADHGHSTVDTWTELTKDDLDNGKLILTDGNSYYLGEDITVTNGAIINGTVNLCLNGKTLKNESGKAVDLNYSASVVVCDCSGNNAGTISGGSVGIWANMSNTKVTLYGGLVSGGKGISLSSSASYSTLTVYGGVVTATKHWGIEQGGIHSTVTVNGGSISGTHGIYSPNMYDGDGISSYNEIHVNGGTITGTTSCGVFAECDVYVSGGTLNGNTYGLSISDDLHTIYLSGAPAISGTTGGIELDGSTITVADTLTNTTPIGITMTNLGTFAKPDGTNVTTLSEYVGKFASDNADCTVVVDGTDLKLVQNEARWGLAVDGKAPTTWVGGGTFIDAVTYANTLQSGTAYIQLLSNVNTTYGISFVSGKTTILDLNGHTIDRGLTTGSNANSEVMGGYVLNAVGNLTLCDSSSSDVSKQGKITGGKNASSYGVENRTNCGGGVHVSSSGTFTLAGGNIEGNVAKQGGGVFSLGSFTMTGGAISGNSATYRGGGVCVQEGAFTMSGGTISDNTTKEGAGVDITNGSFTLSGGFISDNTASLYGGGVQGGPFIMTGGTISGNKADQGGGGVDVTASNTFTMEGGTISDNSASWGAGVNLPANGTFIMSGGTITGNTANDHAGVNAAGSFELSGSPVITGNTIGTGNEAIASNVYQNGDRIVVGILTAGAAIGVSRSSGIGTFTTGGGNYAAYFTSDNADYIVANDGKGNLMLVYPTLTGVVAEGFSGSYDGKAHGITVTAPDGATVKYGTTEGTYDKAESPTITNAGELIVYYQVTKEGYVPATGSAKVSITKATASCTAPVAVEDLIYSGTPQTLITPAATDCGTVQYMGENGAFSSSLPTRTNAGTYYVYYKVIGDANHNDTGVLGPVEVKMDKAPLTIIAKNHTITYGDAPANNGVDYSGFVNGETASALGGTLSYSYSYEQYGNVGEYTITPAGLSSNNYEISYTKGTLTVEQKEIGIKWDNTDLTYNGKEQSPTATATGTVNGDALTLTVDGAQSSASTIGYTATLKGISGDKAGNYKLPGNVVTTFTIAKATPALGNVSVVGTVKDTTDPTDVVLTGTNTTVDGTFALTDEKLLANVTTYHWTFTPTDTANYNVVTGEVEIDVLDTVAPSVVVTVEENQWRTTLNTITFGLFFKETKTVTIEYADNENGSGIDAMLYYVSDKAVADVANIPWKTYSKSFNIDPDGTFVIYAKAVDKDGNSAMVNSDGLVLDATAPLLKDIVDGGIYYGDLTITTSDALAGVKTVTVDGDTVVLENGQYTIAADNSEHTVVVTDKAGNTQQYTVHVMKMYTVNGTVTSYLTGDVTIELLQDGAVKYTTTYATGTGVAYAINDVTAGTYTMRVSKENHVTREYTVVVTDADVSLNVKICPKGDADCNGKVNIRDWNAVKAHNNETALLTGYAYACADTDGNGKVNIRDWNALKNHNNETAPLW